jgi:hypothetical protein
MLCKLFVVCAFLCALIVAAVERPTVMSEIVMVAYAGSLLVGIITVAERKSPSRGGRGL